jgi:hypothetical protein
MLRALWGRKRWRIARFYDEMAKTSQAPHVAATEREAVKGDVASVFLHHFLLTRNEWVKRAIPRRDKARVFHSTMTTNQSV